MFKFAGVSNRSRLGRQRYSQRQCTSPLIHSQQVSRDKGAGVWTKFFLSNCLLSVVVWFSGGEQSLMVGRGANETLKRAIFGAVFCGALNCTQTLRGGQTERRPITKGLAINWRDVVSFGFYSLWFFGSGRDITHLALVFHSLNFLIYIGLRFRLMGFKYQFIAKPRPL